MKRTLVSELEKFDCMPAVYDVWLQAYAEAFAKSLKRALNKKSYQLRGNTKGS